MGGNFKAKCLETNGYYGYTKGKIYKIRDGKFTYDDFDTMVKRIDTIGDLERNSSAIWELIEEEGENKMKDLRELIKPCMVVVRRNGEICALFQCNDGIRLQTDLDSGCCLFEEYDERLKKQGSKGISGFDIMEVYGFTHISFGISIDSRELIWKREETPVKSPTQLEIESIELEQRKLADRLAKLKENV